jgi:hypothetical protein
VGVWQHRALAIQVLSFGLILAQACGSEESGGGGGGAQSGGGSAGSSGGTGGAATGGGGHADGGGSGGGSGVGGAGGSGVGGAAGAVGGAAGDASVEDGAPGLCGPLSGGISDCDICLEDKCCAALQACAQDSTCFDFVMCLQSGKDMPTCTTEVGPPGATFDTFAACVQGSCGTECA